MNIRQLPADVKRILLMLFVSGLLFWSSLSCLFPTLPLYLEDLGAKPFQLGIVMAGFGVGVLAFRPALGKLSDLRSRKSALLIGMAAMAAAPLGYWSSNWMPLLLVVRMLHGISLAGFAAAYLTLVADLTPAANRGEIMGYMSLEQPLGLALGPIVGGFLLAETGGYSIPFLAAAVLGLAATLIACYIPEKPSGQETVTASKKTQAFWLILLSPRLRIPSLMMALVGISIGSLQTYAAPYIRAMEIELNPGLFFTVMAIFTFLIRFLAGSHSDRWGRGIFITYSLTASIIAMTLLWTAHSALVLLLAAALQGSGFGILVPMIAALMADRSPPLERGRAFSLCMMGFDLGLVLGGPLLSNVSESLGAGLVETKILVYRHLFAMATGSIALGLLLFITCNGIDFYQSIRFAIGRAPDAHALALNDR